VRRVQTPTTTQEKAESEKVRYEDWVWRVQTPTTQEKAESEKVRGTSMSRPHHTQEKAESEKVRHGDWVRVQTPTHKRRQRARRGMADLRVQTPPPQ
jgi:hypothetical protein